MDLTVIIGTFGDREYVDMARDRAIPSAESEATTVHYHHEGDSPYGQMLADCRNIPAAVADTEWLCFLDADDELTPGFAEAMEAAEGDLRTPAISYVRPGRGPAAPMFWPEKDIRDSNWMIVSTLIRKTLFFEIGGFRDVPLYEDWDLWQRALIAGAKVGWVRDAVCRVHIRPDSLHRRGTSRQEKAHAHETVRRLNYPELYEQAA